MALEVSNTTFMLSRSKVIETSLILEIDGVPTRYSTTPVLKYIAFGDEGLYFGEDYVFGDTIQDPNTKSYLTSSSGSSITQQLLQDKGAASSVSSLNLEIVDKNEEITRLISPGFVVTELLSKRAIVYLNFAGGFHPMDSVIIHRGIIDDITTTAGSVKLNIASAEQLKRQSLFLKQETELNGSITNSATTITVVSTEGFLAPSTEIHTSYVQIDDELILFTGLTSTTFTGCVRGQLGTVAASHDDGAAVSSFYRLQGNCIDMALKLMLSGPDEYFVTDLSATHIGTADGVTLIADAVFFDIPDVQDRYGLVVGDYLSISGSASNDVVDAVIESFVKTSDGSYIKTDQTFTLEALTTGVVSLKSQYNVLSEGMGMTPQDVDVERHLDILDRFSSGIPSYDFYVKDTLDMKKFISEQLYLPAGLYSLPRKTKASVGITLPPIADTNVSILNSDNVVNPASLTTQRSVNKYYYNSVIYKYNQLALEDKYVSGKVTYSADSQNRFQTIGNKPFKIESNGLRPDDATETLIRTNARRLLERYENAAELVPKVKVLFKDGYPIDVGDTVIFGDTGLKVSDTNNGSRDRDPRLYEVQNKTMNLKTGEVTLDLLLTNFALNGRYGIVSPNSYITTGSTESVIVIEDSFSTAAPEIEKDKWTDYIGLTILIRSMDWSFQEETTLVGFSASDPYEMLVSPPLSVAPSAGYIVDLPVYPTTTDSSTNFLYKIIHCYFDPQLTVATGTSSTVFTVSAPDAAKMYVGSTVRVHSEDFSVDSGEVNVSDITGVTITVDASLGFTPSAGQLIDLVGFPDRGFPYRLI